MQNGYLRNASSFNQTALKLFSHAWSLMNKLIKVAIGTCDTIYITGIGPDTGNDTRIGAALYLRACMCI